ncbi:hypothetical protein [Legionella spiritensis]|uniref:Virulence protein n=1 Tax=Legionella spiritensis TaxID=452 RepID=A0A0W0Z6D0_LEGSP|nr:hypothetical protein [Legionella spiritensis]KTD64690.1 virulence protein [Legionella spiritensis]SNV47897.1 virulence protein [Legionella spiritensis]VEG91370.1 virulence protein [Legionella spiritensis]
MAEYSEEELVRLAEDSRQSIMQDDAEDPVLLVERVYKLWWHWADFSLFIVTPTIEAITPPVIIPPALIPGTEDYEFVYPIHDYGYKLTTSKAEDMFVAGDSMCKLYYTIEKMIYLLIERLKSGGIDQEAEVQVAFGGHELSQRKAFESIINLSYNVVVTNFDPGMWGERFLEVIKRLAEKGYGYPSEAPRESFRQVHGPSTTMKR